MAKVSAVRQMKRTLRVNFLLALGLVALLCIGLAVGAVNVPPARFFATLQEVFSGSPLSYEAVILWRLRLPRVLLAAAVGASLATAGAVLQGLLRNPMADSYVLGVSSGAALGASFVMLLGLQFSFLGLGSVVPSAFVGAIASLIIVVAVARKAAGSSTLGLLLAGIAMSSFLSAIVSLMVFLSREKIQPLVFWLMGGFSSRGWNHLFAILPYLVIGYGLALLFSRQLTAISLGDETAHHLGVNVTTVRMMLLLSSALLTAASVAVSGTIGFVGLMVPHVGRMLVGHNYKRLLPTSALLGAAFLVGADTLARILVRPAELPVGVLTALCGGPFFLYILTKHRRGASI